MSVENQDGKRRFIRGYGATPQQAIQRRNKNLNKAITEAYSSRTQSSGSSKTVKALYDEWIAFKHGKIATSTEEKYREVIENHILPHLSETRINELTTELLNNLFENKLAKIGSSARLHAFKTFSTMLTHAEKHGLLTANPLRLIPAPKHVSAVRKNDDEQASYRNRIAPYLLDWLEDPTNPYHEDYPRVLFMFLGLRRAEILGLTWDCVSNLNRKGKATLTIKQQLDRRKTTGWYIKDTTKTHKARKFHLPERWRKALLKQQATERKGKDRWQEDLIFLKENGNHTDYNYHADRWEEILQAYITKDNREWDRKKYYFRPHAARHITASLMFDQGVPLATVQEILGHSDAAITQYYTHITSEQKKAASQALEKALERKPKTTGKR